MQMQRVLYRVLVWAKSIHEVYHLNLFPLWRGGGEGGRCDTNYGLTIDRWQKKFCLGEGGGQILMHVKFLGPCPFHWSSKVTCSNQWQCCYSLIYQITPSPIHPELGREWSRVYWGGSGLVHETSAATANQMVENMHCDRFLKLL